MKNKILLLILLSGFTFIFSCNELNLNPLSQTSSGNWYSNEGEITMSLSDLYGYDYWFYTMIDGDNWTDDYIQRDMTNAFNNGTLNGEDATINSWWILSYRCIARANTILSNLEKSKGVLAQTIIDKYAGECGLSELPNMLS